VGSFAEDTQVYELDHGLYEAMLGSDWGVRGPNGGSGRLLASGRSLSLLRPLVPRWIR
jgi:hypothetical protein